MSRKQSRRVPILFNGEPVLIDGEPIYDDEPPGNASVSNSLPESLRHTLESALHNLAHIAELQAREMVPIEPEPIEVWRPEMERLDELIALQKQQLAISESAAVPGQPIPSLPPGEVVLPWDDDVLLEELQPLTRRLLKFMMGKSKAHVRDLEQVWEGESMSANALKVAQRRVNTFLLSQKYDRLLEKHNGDDYLRWTR